MLDLARLQGCRLSRVPAGHVNVARFLLYPNFHWWPRRTEIVLEGAENLAGDRRALLAMNHSDKFTYWPLQYEMRRRGLPYTATWVKGKYYHNPFVAWFLMSTNNIPIPSRGYLVTLDLTEGLGRRPGEREYRLLRDAVDAGEAGALQECPSELAGWLASRGGPLRYLEGFETRWEAMLSEVLRLNRSAVEELGLNLLVFPQGTRSKRLSQGHTGMAHMALRLRVPIVPIGANGCDRVYPDGWPLARGGRIVYRVGRPLPPDGPELSRFSIQEDYLPMSRGAARYEDRFRALTELVMDRIDELLDPEYRYSEDQRSQGVQGVDRFL